MPAPPRSFLILPDPTLMGAGDGPITAFSTQAEPDGRSAGLAVPRSTNRGAVTFTQVNTPAPALRRDLTYKVIASGGVWGEGTWAWKRATEAEPGRTALGYRGQNDCRYPHAPHDPFRNDAANASPTMCVAYLPLLRRECVFRPSNAGGIIQVAYRTVDTHEYSFEAGSGATWSVTNCLNTDTAGNLTVPGVGANAYGFDVVDLLDGTLIMVVESRSEFDLDVLQSTDGINWTPVADNILARFGKYGTAGSATFMLPLELGRSGDYLRICFGWFDGADVLGTGAANIYIRTLVSGDRGASWVESSSNLATYFNVNDLGGGTFAFDQIFGMDGLDDAAGTFLLAMRQEGSTTMKIFMASGINDWTYYPDLDYSHGVAGVFHLACARGPEYLYIFNWCSSTGVNYWDLTLFYVDPRNPTDLSGWKYERETFKSLGAICYLPLNCKFANIGGNYLAMTAALFSNTTLLFQSQMMYLRWGGWDKLPVEERDHPELSEAPDYMQQPGIVRSSVATTSGYSLALITWDAWMGKATVAAAADCAATSPWTRPAYANVTTSWHTSRWRLTDVAAVNNQYVNLYTDPVLAVSWAAESSFTSTGGDRCSALLEVIIRVTAGGVTTADDVAVRLRSFDCVTGSGIAVDFSLRFSTTQVALYDNAAAAYVLAATNLANLATRFWKVRVGLLSQPWKAGDPCAVAIWARDEENAAADWTLLGTGTLNMGSATLEQTIRFGHLTVVFGAVRASEWRSVRLYGPHDGGTTRSITDGWGDTGGGAGNDDSVLANLRGRLMTYDQVLVESGISVLASGGGGFEGDAFDAVTDYAYHPRNATMVGSPRVAYRSAIPSSGHTTAVIDYDAGWNDTGNRFIHDCLAVYGYGSRTLQVTYTNDSAFLTGLVTYTLSLDRYGPFRIANAYGNAITVSTTDAQCPPRGEVGSEPNGGPQQYLKITALTGGATAAALGATYVVSHDFEASGVRGFKLQTADQDVSAWTLVGCSAVIFADRGVLLYGTTQISRYMRVTLPLTSTAYGNQHRLGTLLPGLSMVFDPPLDWSHSDGEQANLSEFRSRGAVRWGYAEGPPQRVWEGLVVGDIDVLRRTMRSWLRALSQYDVLPVGLCVDDGALIDPSKVVLGTVKSGTELSNEGWNYTGNRWVPVGNLKFTLHEEP